MKRLLVLFAVLVPLSFFIAGCGGGKGGSTPKTPQDLSKSQMESVMKSKGVGAPKN